MRIVFRLTLFAMLVLGGLPQSASADVNVYVGYLNNLSGPPNPADIPTPFDPDANTILVGSGGVSTPHDAGVIRFQNLCDVSVTINAGLNVTTQVGFFQIWDPFLPIVLAPGQNLVLTETANFNFDTSDFGLGSNPVVSGSVNGMPFSFTDTSRVLLGHEEAGNTPETTPYGLLGTVNCTGVPEPSTLALSGLGTVGLLVYLRRQRKPAPNRRCG